MSRTACQRFPSHPNPATAANELELLAVAKAGRGTPEGNDAAARVLALHRGLLIAHCERALIGGFELDDLLQEAQLGALDAMRYFKPELGYKFTTYMMDCVRNRLGKVMKDRRQKPLPQEGEATGEVKPLDLIPGREPEPGTADGPGAHAAVDLEWLAGAMSHLSPLERQVLTLKYGLEGGGELDDKAIGGRLGVSGKTAEWVAWQAALKLKRVGPPPT